MKTERHVHFPPDLPEGSHRPMNDFRKNEFKFSQTAQSDIPKDIVNYHWQVNRADSKTYELFLISINAGKQFFWALRNKFFG